MRLSTIALLGALVFSAAPAGAQTVYSRLASQDELSDGGRFAGVQPTCIERNFGTYLFFDDASDQILRFTPSAAVGSRTEVVISAADLDALAQTDVTQCRDAVTSTIAYFALSNAANEDLIISFTANVGNQRQLLASGPSADGISALATVVIGSIRLYVARAQFFGAPEDGIYLLSSTGLTPVVTNPDLDLVGLSSSNNGDLYATSSEFGVGQYKNKIIRVTDPRNAATLSILADPFAGPNPLFVNGDDGGLEDLFVGEQGNVERIFVVNNSFGAPLGETIGRYDLDGSNPTLVFTESALIASPAAMATPTSAFTAAGGNGYLTFGTTANQNGQVNQILLASRSGNNGQAAIFSLDVSNLTTASEQAEAAEAGYAVEMANPVRGVARVRLVQPEPAAVRASVVDVLGREVAVLAEGTRAVESEATFDASALAPGVYHVVFRSGGFTATHSVTVVR